MHPSLAKILDPKSAKEICEVDPGLFDELLVLFSEQLPIRMTSLSEHLKKGEKKDAERMVHTLKSSAAQIGAMELSELCREFEASVYQCTEEYVKTQTLKIDKCATILLHAIEEHLKSQPKAA